MKKSTLFLLITINYLSAQVQIGNSLNGINTDDLFGFATAISANGTIIAVGSPTISNDGFVNTFQYNGSTWSTIGNPILESDNQGNFGSVISLSNEGNVLAIASPYYDDIDGQVENLGRVQIYNLISGNWIQSGNSIIGTGSNHLLGKSIALSSDGNKIAIGIPGFGSNNQRGAVQIYTLINNNWTILGNSINAVVNDDNFGNEISFSSDGNTIAIADFNSSMLPNKIGKVKIYNYVSGSWIQKGNSILGQLSEDTYRKFVSLNNDGSILAIGIPGSDALGPFTGKVEVYNFQYNNWQQIGNDIFGSAMNDYLGGSINISEDGTVLYVGSPGYNQFSGRLTIFKNINSTWVDIGLTLEGDEAGTSLSNSIAISSDNKFIVGLPFNDSFSGQVKVFDINALLSIKSESELDFELYPNPIKDGKLFIKQAQIQLEKIDIYDITGKLLKSTALNFNSNHFDLSDLNAGVYIIKLNSRLGNLTKKIIIE